MSPQRFVEEALDENENTLLGQYVVYSSSKEGVAYEVTTVPPAAWMYVVRT